MLDNLESIVNPVAVKNCFATVSGIKASVLDISFVRLVLEAAEGWDQLPADQVLNVDLSLADCRFSAMGLVRARGEGWMRMSFEPLLPSARAHLRSFLSPKRVGESILEDWSTEEIRHFHGLNESELWFQPHGAVLFTYLDCVDTESQFIIRMSPKENVLIAGKVLRRDYIALKSIEDTLPFVFLDDKEVCLKLGECRDIITNFRPAGYLEYNLKQKLLRVISDYLYSTSRKVDMSQVSTMRTLPLFSRT
jgi:hypothetical protein